MELCCESRKRAVTLAPVYAGITHGPFNPLYSIQGPLNDFSCPFSASIADTQRERDEFSLHCTKNGDYAFFTKQEYKKHSVN